MDHIKALDKAKIALMSKADSAFFTTVCFSLKHIWDETIPTACTNGTEEVLELRSTDKTSKEWFGDISLTLQPEFAIDLGNALVSAGYNKLAQLKAGNC